MSPHGKLEVLLVSAKGLENSDFLSSMDPYVLLTCRTQEQKSSVSTDKGSNPEWNETFVFTVSGEVPHLNLKLMEKDNFSADDFLGEVSIPLDVVFERGEVEPTSYNVVKDEEFKGEIRVGLTFTPERGYDRGLPEEEFGGWKDSSY